MSNAADVDKDLGEESQGRGLFVENGYENATRKLGGCTYE
jgi:hypothetical protein